MCDLRCGHCHAMKGVSGGIASVYTRRRSLPHASTSGVFTSNEASAADDRNAIRTCSGSPKYSILYKIAAMAIEDCFTETNG